MILTIYDREKICVAETPEEMRHLLKRREAAKRESMRPMQKEDEMQQPVPPEKGLGEAPAKKETEAEVGKLIEDLRADANWLETSPLPEELIVNIRKAARILEIDMHCRECHTNVEDTEREQIQRALEMYQ